MSSLLNEQQKIDILLLKDKKYTLKNIAIDVGCSPEGARRFISRFSERGSIDNVWNQGGRPTKYTARDVRHMNICLSKDPFVSLSEVQHRVNENLSRPTIHRMEKKEGYCLHRLTKKKRLTPLMKKNRFDWAKKYVEFDDEFWYSIIYTDEVHLYLRYDDPKKFYKKRLKLTIQIQSLWK